MISMTMMGDLRDVLLGHVSKPQGIDNANQTVIDLFSAWCAAKYGPAEGSTARQDNSGKIATRYWDAEFERLRWLVLNNPEIRPLGGERCDQLPGYNWTVTPRAWQDLVHRAL